MIQNYCIICVSPYRKEIISLSKRGASAPEIWKRYRELLNYKGGSKAFYLVLRRHFENKHNTDAIIVPKENKVSPATIEGFGKKMLELGMAKIEDMNEKDVQLKDVIQAQKLVLDSKKLKLNEDTMMLMMGKLFGPKIDPDEAIEGEVKE